MQVALIHTAPELATDYDAVVEPPLAGTPFTIVVQTDLRGCVHRSQITQKVSHLTEPTMQAVNAVTISGKIQHGSIWSGPPLHGMSDGRWDFKAAEGRAFRRLTLSLEDIAC